MPKEVKPYGLENMHEHQCLSCGKIQVMVGPKALCLGHDCPSCGGHIMAGQYCMHRWTPTGPPVYAVDGICQYCGERIPEEEK